MRARGCLLILLWLCPLASGEVVRLLDGSFLEGDIKRAGDGYDVYDAAGKRTHIPSDRIKSIELKTKGDPRDQAAARLASLRRSVEALSDLKQIISRYEQFIEQNRGQPIAEEAARDLVQWKERFLRGMVKSGGQWVLPEQRAALQEKALLEADHARDLLRQNKLKEAEATVNAALAGDPANVSALYLRGLILYRQDRIPDARKAIEAVKEKAPDHGPTLNNLAVVLWRQNQHMPALNAYLAAMQAMPLSQQILNNVAEALNSLTEKERAGQLAQKVYKLWVEQDTQLQQQLMPQGLYRWGATWVDKAEHEKLEAAEKEVKDKIAKMEEEFAEAQASLETIDAKMRANSDAMRVLERTRYAYDAAGRLIAYPLPPQYWDYDRANRLLEVQRQQTAAQMDALRNKAQAIKQQLPVPKFTGLQLTIGPEGTPAAPPQEHKPVPANLLDQVGGGGPPADNAAAPAPQPKPDNRPLKY